MGIGRQIASAHNFTKEKVHMPAALKNYNIFICIKMICSKKCVIFFIKKKSVIILEHCVIFSTFCLVKSL